MKVTNQLVNTRRGPHKRSGGPAAATRPRAARPAGAASGSRTRLCAAAAREFAAHGFAGASVDRIAAAARVNKAMIYYHFGSKAALYREILSDMFQAVGHGARAAADAEGGPAAKIGLFIESIAAAADARPHFPTMWFRELAEGGAHVDRAVLHDISSVVQSLTAIIDEGAARGTFVRVDPMLIHAGIVAPLMMFFVSARIRPRLERAGVPRASTIGRDEFVDHVRRVTLGVLEGPAR